MTDLPDMRVKALVSFPASVIGGTGVSVTKNTGEYTFNLDYSELMQVSLLASPSTHFVVLWNSATGVYSRISLPDLKAALASIP